MPHDAPRFRQHDLDKARVLFGLGGERDRLGDGVTVRDIDQPPFGLRDDLLRDDQNIARLRRDVGLDQRRDA